MPVAVATSPDVAACSFDSAARMLALVAPGAVRDGVLAELRLAGARVLLRAGLRFDDAVVDFAFRALGVAARLVAGVAARLVAGVAALAPASGNWYPRSAFAT
ncbi:MAG TPA: hypothetical protein VG275_06180 [Solirubrobacteraceae bacterium]|nr:hypothetical protein [Solirubrobacteraceae bacterium]